MENILERVGKDMAINQLRVGIGPSPGVVKSPNFSLVEYVLQKFSKEESENIPHVSNTVADCLNDWIEMGPNYAMNKYNSIDVLNDRKKDSQGLGRTHMEL